MKIVMMMNFGVLNQFVDFSASYMEVRLRGFVGPKIWCVLYMSAAYTQVYTVAYRDAS